MSNILLTQDTGKILGPVSKLLGYIMEGIFNVLYMLKIPNIGLAIILFTIVIYLLLMPLTIKQQKFSKLSAKMNPELQAIQKKYKNKKDNDSMMAMNMETQAVYAKYGVSPSGSCVQLLIQMPILLALYRVIGNIPAYVPKVYKPFEELAKKIISVDNGAFLINYKVEKSSILSAVGMYSKNLESDLLKGIVDVLNKVSSSDMNIISKNYGLSELALENCRNESQYILSIVDEVGNIDKIGLIDSYNNFLNLSMSNSPAFTFNNAIKTSSVLMMIAALSIPVLAALTQWINVKLMPQQEMNTDNEQQNTMMQSMKTMNMVMPIMSAVFCYTLPAGMGLYWVAGAVVRSIQQILINKHIDKMDLDEVIKKNEDKAKKKMEKAGQKAEKMAAYAGMNTKNAGMSSKASVPSSLSQEEKEELVKKSTEYYSKNAKPGSMMAKANMVKEYNEKKNK